MAADNWKTDKEPSVRVAVALSYKIDSCKGVTSPDLASHSLEGPAPPSEALQGRAGWSFGGWGWLLPEFVCSRLNFIIFVSFHLSVVRVLQLLLPLPAIGPAFLRLTEFYIFQQKTKIHCIVKWMVFLRCSSKPVIFGAFFFTLF